MTDGVQVKPFTVGHLKELIRTVPDNWPVRFVDQENGHNIYDHPLPSDDLHRDASRLNFRIIVTEDHFVIDTRD